MDLKGRMAEYQALRQDAVQQRKQLEEHLRQTEMYITQLDGAVGAIDDLLQIEGNPELETLEDLVRMRQKQTASAMPGQEG